MGLNPGLNWSSSCSFGAFAHESNSNIDSSMLVFMVVRYLCTSCGSCGTICKLLQKLMRICLSDFRLQCWRMLIVMIIHHVTIGLWKLYCVQCVAWMSRCTVVMNHWKTIHTLGDCRLFKIYWLSYFHVVRFTCLEVPYLAAEKFATAIAEWVARCYALYTSLTNPACWAWGNTTLLGERRAVYPLVHVISTDWLHKANKHVLSKTRKTEGLEHGRLMCVPTIVVSINKEIFRHYPHYDHKSFTLTDEERSLRILQHRSECCHAHCSCEMPSSVNIRSVREKMVTGEQRTSQ